MPLNDSGKPEKKGRSIDPRPFRLFCFRLVTDRHCCPVQSCTLSLILFFQFRDSLIDPVQSPLQVFGLSFQCSRFISGSAIIGCCLRRIIPAAIAPAITPAIAIAPSETAAVTGTRKSTAPQTACSMIAISSGAAGHGACALGSCSVKSRHNHSLLIFLHENYLRPRP